ncbi:immunoglobulin I-set domain protein, partial [Oesophagostomum dentatum]
FLKGVLKVALRTIPGQEKHEIPSEQPDWATGAVKLAGNVEARFKKLPSPPKEVEIPARDQITLKVAKPKPASEVETGEHVKIAEEKAKLKAVQQGPEQPKEEIIPHKQQVELKTKFTPIVAKPGESVKIDSKPLKEIPPVEKPLIEMTSISNKPQPTKIGVSKQAPPTVSQQLKPIQGEPGKAAKFIVNFDGAAPIKVTWFKDGKEIKSTFRNQITTTDKSSTLHIGRLENSHAGLYLVRLENVAGTVESSANLTLSAPADKGKAPDFTARMNDLRIPQNGPAVFTCTISGEPRPTVNWFKASYFGFCVVLVL